MMRDRSEDMTPNQARLSAAQMRVAEAVGKIEDEELREEVLAAIRELTAAWRAVLDQALDDLTR